MSNADLADFGSKEKARIRPRITGLMAPAFVWALVLALLAFVVPKFEVVFRDFGLDLGWMMLVIVRASHLSLALLGLVVVLLVVDSIVRDLLAAREDRRRLALAWSSLMFGLPLATFSLMIVAIGTTLTGLLFKLSG